jgi:glycogen(starch) synthase
MRLLVLSWEYPPVIEGGLARHVAKLSEALSSLGVEVHVLTRGSRALPREQRSAGVVIHRVQTPPRPSALGRFIAWVAEMNRAMIEAGRDLAQAAPFDLVAGHDWLVARAGDRLSGEQRVPLVITIHATEYGRHQGHVDDYPQRLIHETERWIVGRADRVITCSHYMRGHVADVLGVPEERIAVIPNGIDPLELRPLPDLGGLRDQLCGAGERLVLLVGRLVYEKGFQVALEALAPIVAKDPKVRFVVAGSGTYERQLKELAANLGIAEQGRFLGWIDDALLHSLYRVADLCVVPSLYEPFGLVALEAMASGCPCIVADTGGLREVVPPGDRVGLRFNGGDAAHLAMMIERLLYDEALRERLVAEASEHVLRFDWRDVAKRTIDLYREVLSPGRRSQPHSRSRALT